MNIEILESFIAQNDLKDITFITHGRGSSIAVGYAVRNPEQVRAFIMMNAMDFSDFTLPYRLQLCRVKWLKNFLLYKCKLMFWELLRSPRLLRECYALPFRKPEDYVAIRHFVENIPGGPDADSAMSMYEIEAGLWLLRDKPTAIFWAKHDWLYGAKCLRHWKKYFPEAEVHTLKHSGRYLLEDNPEQLNDMIRDFLERNRC
jgi:haloalkane dehalogenase